MLEKLNTSEDQGPTEPTTSDESYPPDIVCGINSQQITGISLFRLASKKPIIIGEAGLKASRILAQIQLEENQEKLLEDISKSIPSKSVANKSVPNKKPDQAGSPRSPAPHSSSFSSSGGSLKRSCPVSPIKGAVTPILKYRRGSATQFKPPTISDTSQLPTKIKVQNRRYMYDSDNQATRIPLIESSISISSLVTPPETPNQSIDASLQDNKCSMGDWSSENLSDESFDFDEDDAEISRLVNTSLLEQSIQNVIH